MKKKGGGLRNSKKKSKRREEEEDLFSNLPAEIVLCILSRLPIRTLITSCKFVCKSWRHLISSHEFAVSHFSQSAPFLAIFESGGIGIHEADVDHGSNKVIGFDFPHPPVYVHSSANGLLFLLMSDQEIDFFFHKEFICNPVTREYIKLPWHKANSSYKEDSLNYGFGVSRVSGLCKVVRIFRQFFEPPFMCTCDVYTLGTGSWRGVEAPNELWYPWRTSRSVVLRGNLYWLVCEGSQLYRRPYVVSCFDLETERFSTFTIPQLDGGNHRRLYTLGEDYGLCLCVDSDGGGYDIWSMKEYGDDKSWRKEFVIKDRFYKTPLPVKIFKDGHMLLEEGHGGSKMYWYSNGNTSFKNIKPSRRSLPRTYVDTAIYTPSFLPLKTSVTTELVSSF